MRIGKHGITDHATALTAHPRGSADSCPPNDDPSRSRSFLDRGLLRWRGAHIAEALGQMEQAVRLSVPRGSELSDAEVLLVVQLTQLRELARAEELLDAAVHRRGGTSDPAVTALRAHVRLAQGRAAAARELATEGIARGGRAPVVSLAHLVLATVSLRYCDLRAAVRYARHLSEDSLFGRLSLIRSEAAWVVAQVIEVERGTDAAARLMAEVTDRALQDHELLVGQPAAAPSLVRSALACQDRETAEQVARTARLVAERNRGFHAPLAAAVHATSLVDGRIDGLLRAATDHVDPWARARATEDAGMVLVGRHDGRDKGTALLKTALRGYTSVGSPHDVARVRSVLRAGTDGQSTRTGKMMGGGKHGLTATETRITDLVAQGLTNVQVANQLYLSRHTVAYHLKSIFGKLGVSSRGQLTSLWAQLRLVSAASQDSATTAPRAGR